MIDNKLPLYKRGDVLRNNEHDFDWIIHNCYECDDWNFEYSVSNGSGLIHYISEDELFSEFTLLEDKYV